MVADPQEQADLYPAACYDLAHVFASKGGVDDPESVRAQLLFNRRCIWTAGETAWYKQYAFLNGANACFHLNRLESSSRHSKTGLAFLCELLSSPAISSTCKLTALAYAAKLTAQQYIQERDPESLDRLHGTLTEIRLLLAKLTLDDAELLQLAEMAVHEVYRRSSDTVALHTYLEILGWHIAQIPADNKAGRGLLLGQRAEALHELYESDHDSQTLFDAMESMVEAMQLVVNAKEHYLEMGLKLRTMLHSYEDRGGDIYTLSPAVLNVAFSAELENYSLTSALERLKEWHETQGAFPFRSIQGWSFEAAETYQTLSDQELRDEVDQLTDQVEKLAVGSPQSVKMLFCLARAKDESYQRSLMFADLRSAVSRYEECLRYSSASQFSQGFLLTALSYGQLLYARGHVQRAMELFSEARQAAITLPGFTQDELLDESDSLQRDRFPELIPLLTSRGEIRDAFEMAQLAKRPALQYIRPGILFDVSGVGKEQTASVESWRGLRNRRRSIGELIEKLQSVSPQEDATRYALRVELLRQHLAEKEALEHLSSLLGRHPGISRLNRAGLVNFGEILPYLVEFKTVAVEYVRHSDGWSAFALDKGGIQYFPLPGLSASLLTDVTGWVNSMSRPDGRSLDVNQRVLTDLYQAAVAPFAGLIERNTQIIFAADSDLRRVPLQLAMNPSSNRYLIDDYPVSFVDNLTDLYYRLRSVQANFVEERGEIPAELLSIAYPGRTGSSDYLSMAVKESTGLCSLFNPSSALLESEAAVDAILERAKGKTIIHAACHGVSGANYGDDGLVLADGVLTVRRIQDSLDLLETKLVILASCKSGHATIVANRDLDWIVPAEARNDVQNVARAFLSVGAETVVASMWETSDFLSQRIVQEFGSQIAKDLDPSSALRNAMLTVRNDQNFALLAHPFYWAGFQVHGVGVVGLR